MSVDKASSVTARPRATYSMLSLHLALYIVSPSSPVCTKTVVPGGAKYIEPFVRGSSQTLPEPSMVIMIMGVLFAGMMYDVDGGTCVLSISNSGIGGVYSFVHSSICWPRFTGARPVL